MAEEKSFTAAACRYTPQQVLSTQIRQLEDILGVRLLDRTSRGAELTVAGTTFLVGARATLTELDRAVAAALNSATAVSGVLPVGLNVAAAGELPSELLARFQRAEPDVEVRLRTFDLTHPAAGLLDHSTDVAFVRPPVRAEGITVRQLAAEPRVFVLAADHPLARRAALELGDTAGLPWITAAAAADGCDPTAWRDDWLMSPRPTGDQPIIGAIARTIEEWREYADRRPRDQPVPGVGRAVLRAARTGIRSSPGGPARAALPRLAHQRHHRGCPPVRRLRNRRGAPGQPRLRAPPHRSARPAPQISLPGDLAATRTAPPGSLFWPTAHRARQHLPRIRLHPGTVPAGSTAGLGQLHLPAADLALAPGMRGTRQ